LFHNENNMDLLWFLYWSLLRWHSRLMMNDFGYTVTQSPIQPVCTVSLHYYDCSGACIMGGPMLITT
jgi:hypothetical protein